MLRCGVALVLVRRAILLSEGLVASQVYGAIRFRLDGIFQLIHGTWNI